MSNPQQPADHNDPHIVSESIEVLASPEVVFNILADPAQHSRIDGSGSVRGMVKGPSRLSKGDQFGIDMKMFGLPYKIRNRVVEFEKDSLIAWRHFGAHRWRYELEPTAGGTRVTESFDFTRYGKLARRALELAGFPDRNRQGIDATLVKLKQAAETDAQAS